MFICEQISKLYHALDGRPEEMLKSFGKILKGSKKGSPNAEFDDLESVLKSTHGCRKRARNHSGESKGGMHVYICIYMYIYIYMCVCVHLSLSP